MFKDESLIFCKIPVKIKPHFSSDKPAFKPHSSTVLVIYDCSINIIKLRNDFGLSVYQCTGDLWTDGTNTKRSLETAALWHWSSGRQWPAAILWNLHDLGKVQPTRCESGPPLLHVFSPSAVTLSDSLDWVELSKVHFTLDTLWVISEVIMKVDCEIFLTVSLHVYDSDT